MEFGAFARYVDLGAISDEAAFTVQPEAQHGDYEAGVVMIGSERWRIRTARITPTKPGAFVAVWRRGADGSTRPFGAEDPTSGLLVFVEEATRFGVFRFTAAHLVSLGVTQTDRCPGKRGFRVYPTWCSGLNPQAARSQRAQSPAFVDLLPQP